MPYGHIQINTKLSSWPLGNKALTNNHSEVVTMTTGINSSHGNKPQDVGSLQQGETTQMQFYTWPLW